MAILLHRVAFCVACVCSFVAGGLVQTSNITLPASSRSHRDAVVKIFVDSYQAYRTFAFGNDELVPVTNSISNSRNGWGATIVDSMPTMAIMELYELFDEGVEFSKKIDFNKSKTADAVSVFESTIRYMGGLLSAYELSDKKHAVLVQKAKELGDKLALAWVGNNVIPFSSINFTTNTPVVAMSNIAEAGSLALEWSTLSRYTGNDTYRKLAEGALRHIALHPAPLPGLAAQDINPATGDPVEGYITWGGGSDSYFEYLVKYPRLTNTDDHLFMETWAMAVDSSIKYLIRNSTIGNYMYLADYDSARQIRHISSHLACFHGGNWIFGGKLLDNQTIVEFGLALVDGCWNTYAKTATSIGPEAFAFISPDGNFTGQSPITPQQLEFYNKNGFYFVNPSYALRPEVIESIFYAWRATGDTKYLDRAAEVIHNFQMYLSTTSGFSGIDDVNSKNSSKSGIMESFWFAEVLKYLYLIFDDPERISIDKFVFNTEGQPFMAPKARTSYTSSNIIPLASSPPKVRTENSPEVAKSQFWSDLIKRLISPLTTSGP